MNCSNKQDLATPAQPQASGHSVRGIWCSMGSTPNVSILVPHLILFSAYRSSEVDQSYVRLIPEVTLSVAFVVRRGSSQKKNKKNVPIIYHAHPVHKQPRWRGLARDTQVQERARFSPYVPRSLLSCSHGQFPTYCIILQVKQPHLNNWQVPVDCRVSRFADLQNWLAKLAFVNFRVIPIGDRRVGLQSRARRVARPPVRHTWWSAGQRIHLQSRKTEIIARLEEFALNMDCSLDKSWLRASQAASRYLHSFPEAKLGLNAGAAVRAHVDVSVLLAWLEAWMQSQCFSLRWEGVMMRLFD